MNQSADDRDLMDMARLAAGKESALSDLVERHGQKLFNYLIRCLQNQEEAADLAQETFVRVYQNRDKFNSKQRFSTWIYAIATNLVRDRYRWRTRHPEVLLDHTADSSETNFADQIPEASSNPSEMAQAAELAEAVRGAVAKLPEELRTPLILAEYEEKSQAEIAAILDCSVKAVETRIYRARKQLRDLLGHILQRDDGSEMKNI